VKTTGVMQIVDTLETGGAERVAVNIANHLPRDQYRSFLCTTRRDGPLEEAIEPDVRRLRLERKSTLDVGAIRRLVKFIRANDIRILHPHGASIFIAAAAARFAPDVRVIWHDHFGRCGTEERPAWLYRQACSRVSGVIAVNEMLVEWSRTKLGVPADRVWYVANFVEIPSKVRNDPALPGEPGRRIVCVANFRPQKDHLNLIHAMKKVIECVPDAHLLLVGPLLDDPNLRAVRTEIFSLGLTTHVSFLGQRTDVPQVLQACDVGVLSSNSEGLPLSLLEYGAAGIAAVSTRVGQCAEVLDEGGAGILVPHSSSTELADGIVALLKSPEQRAGFAERLNERVVNYYSAEAAIQEVCQTYDIALAERVTDSVKRAPKNSSAHSGRREPSVTTFAGKSK
jgi:glycosyltransferase involved in cell wall biosynthesis